MILYFVVNIYKGESKMSWRAKLREQAKEKLCTVCKKYVDKTEKICPHCKNDFFFLSKDNNYRINPQGNVYCGCEFYDVPTLEELIRDSEVIKDGEYNRRYSYHKCRSCGSIYSFELVTSW